MTQRVHQRGEGRGRGGRDGRELRDRRRPADGGFTAQWGRAL